MSFLDINKKKAFCSFFSKVISKYGVQFNSSTIEKYDVPMIKTILAGMDELKKLECDVIIYILDQVDDEMYKAMKWFAEIKFGKICII